MARILDEVIAELTAISGSQQIDAHDGHERWALYRQAIESGRHTDLLVEVVELEPDPSIALSLVLYMLEQVPSDSRAVWISRLSVEKDKEYASKRASELGILESVAAEATTNIGDDAPDAWSDWLQLRLAKECRDRAVLRLLGQHGRTKRIRHSAMEGMRSLDSE